MKPKPKPFSNGIKPRLSVCFVYLHTIPKGGATLSNGYRLVSGLEVNQKERHRQRRHQHEMSIAPYVPPDQRAAAHNSELEIRDFSQPLSRYLHPPDLIVNREELADLPSTPRKITVPQQRQSCYSRAARWRLRCLIQNYHKCRIRGLS